MRRAPRWAVALAGLLAGVVLTVSVLGARQQEKGYLTLDGSDWAAMDAGKQVAWTQGFLAGRALGQLPESVAVDTTQAAQQLAQLKKGGALVFPYAPSLYASRLGDYYHWDNHRPNPLWRGMLDVNAELRR